jgi:hypothetical protein
MRKTFGVKESSCQKAKDVLAQAYEREVRREIGEGLRRTDKTLEREPLPSDWLKLIDDLEASRSCPAITPSIVLERLWQRLRFRE